MPSNIRRHMIQAKSSTTLIPAGQKKKHQISSSLPSTNKKLPYNIIINRPSMHLVLYDEVVDATRFVIDETLSPHSHSDTMTQD